MSRTATTTTLLTLGLLSMIALSTTGTAAFDVTFPGPADYWVACGWNNMTWKSYSTDPQIVTIMLTNSNKTLLNDDFEIGNALQGSDNAAMIYLPCLPAATGYSLMFVNASHYDHKQTTVLYTSAQFIIKPKGTSPSPASGQTSIPSQYQPYYQTPGIVLPPSSKANGKPDSAVNTTANGNTIKDANGELAKLDGASASFGTFHPVQNTNGGVWQNALVGDLIFVAVIAAFSVLVIMS